MSSLKKAFAFWRKLREHEKKQKYLERHPFDAQFLRSLLNAQATSQNQILTITIWRKDGERIEICGKTEAKKRRDIDALEDIGF